MIRLFRVPNRSIGRCIDNRKDYTSTVGTCSGNDAGVSDVIGVGDIGTYIQPTAYLVVDIGTEAVSFEVRTFQNSFFIQITGREEVFHLFVSVRHGHLIVLSLSGFVNLVKPVCLVC